MKAVIYARYSSDLQSKASIEDQVRVCRERADKMDFEVVDVFTDAALSGSRLQNRPSIQKLLERARAPGSFDVVITEALDRLSRDQEDIAGLFKRLAHLDIRIHTLSEGDINELHVGLKGTMNAVPAQISTSLRNAGDFRRLVVPSPSWWRFSPPWFRSSPSASVAAPRWKSS